MFFMRRRCKSAFWDAKLLSEPVPFISPLSSSGVYLIVVAWRLDVKLVWVNSDDGAIFLVHAFDFEGVLSTAHHIIVKFIPAESQSSISNFVLLFLEGSLVP